jgi:hypothetical protein
MRQLQLIAHGEPSQVIELKTVPEPPLGHGPVRPVIFILSAIPLDCLIQ